MWKAFELCLNPFLVLTSSLCLLSACCWCCSWKKVRSENDVESCYFRWLVFICSLSEMLMSWKDGFRNITSCIFNCYGTVLIKITGFVYEICTLSMHLSGITLDSLHTRWKAVKYSLHRYIWNFTDVIW